MKYDGQSHWPTCRCPAWSRCHLPLFWEIPKFWFLSKCVQICHVTPCLKRNLILKVNFDLSIHLTSFPNNYFSLIIHGDIQKSCNEQNYLMLYTVGKIITCWSTFLKTVIAKYQVICSYLQKSVLYYSKYNKRSLTFAGHLTFLYTKSNGKRGRGWFAQISKYLVGYFLAWTHSPEGSFDVRFSYKHQLFGPEEW